MEKQLDFPCADQHDKCQAVVDFLFERLAVYGATKEALRAEMIRKGVV